jgi:hypothetical protein
VLPGNGFDIWWPNRSSITKSSYDDGVEGSEIGVKCHPISEIKVEL